MKFRTVAILGCVGMMVLGATRMYMKQPVAACADYLFALTLIQLAFFMKKVY